MQAMLSLSHEVSPTLYPQTSSSHRLNSRQSFFFSLRMLVVWLSTYGTLHGATTQLSLAATSKPAHPPATFKGVGLR